MKRLSISPSSISLIKPVYCGYSLCLYRIKAYDRLLKIAAIWLSWASMPLPISLLGSSVHTFGYNNNNNNNIWIIIKSLISIRLAPQHQLMNVIRWALTLHVSGLTFLMLALEFLQQQEYIFRNKLNICSTSCCWKYGFTRVRLIVMHSKDLIALPCFHATVILGLLKISCNNFTLATCWNTRGTLVNQSFGSCLRSG